MTKNRKTQRKFRRKSSKKSVDKRRTKVNHKRKNLHKKTNKKNKKILNRRNGGGPDGESSPKSECIDAIVKKINEIKQNKSKDEIISYIYDDVKGGITKGFKKDITNIIDNYIPIFKYRLNTGTMKEKIYNGVHKAIIEFALPDGEEKDNALKKYRETYGSPTETKFLVVKEEGKDFDYETYVAVQEVLNNPSEAVEEELNNPSEAVEEELNNTSKKKINTHKPLSPKALKATESINLG